MEQDTGTRERGQKGLEEKVIECDCRALKEARGLGSGQNRAAEQLLKGSGFINRSSSNKEWLQCRKLFQIGMAELVQSCGKHL